MIPWFSLQVFSIVSLKDISTTFLQRENRLASKHAQWTSRHGKFFQSVTTSTPKICQNVVGLSMRGWYSWKKERKKENERKAKKKKWTDNLINSTGNIRNSIYLIIFTACWNTLKGKALFPKIGPFKSQY